MEQADTKNCPYCGEEILSIAIKCKHCGEFLVDQPNPETTPSASLPAQPVQRIEVKAKEGCFLQTLNLGCIVIVVALVAFTLFLIIANQ